MPDWLVLMLRAAGFLLNIVGLYCAGKAYVSAWRVYGDGDLWPAFSSNMRRTSAVARRMMFRTSNNRQVPAVSGAGHSHSSASGHATVKDGFVSHASEGDRITALERAVEGIYDDLCEDRSIANRRDSEIREQLRELSMRMAEEDARLESLSREVASVDVRRQLVGLLLIGVGTCLTALPDVLSILVSIGRA